MIIVSLVVSALILIAMSLFPTISKAFNSVSGDMKKYFEGMDNINSYFESQVGTAWIALISLYSAILAVKLVTKELKNTSYQIVYTTGISRGEIIRTKLLVLFINITLANILCAVASVTALAIWGTAVNYGNFAIYAVTVWLVTLILGLLVFGMALIFRRKMGFISAIVVVLLLDTIASLGISNAVQWVGYFSPFSVVYGSIMTAGFSGLLLHGIPLVIWGVLSAAVLTLGYTRFNKADLC